MKTFYTFLGSITGAAVNILYNLIAAAIQKRTFNDQFDDRAVAILIVLVVLGMLGGYFIGRKIDGNTKSQSSSQTFGGTGELEGNKRYYAGSSSKYSINAKNIGSIGDGNTTTVNISDSKE